MGNPDNPDLLSACFQSALQRPQYPLASSTLTLSMDSNFTLMCRIRCSAVAMTLIVLGLWAGGIGSAATASVACVPLPRASAANFLVRLTDFMNKLCYLKANRHAIRTNHERQYVRFTRCSGQFLDTC